MEESAPMPPTFAAAIIRESGLVFRNSLNTAAQSVRSNSLEDLPITSCLCALASIAIAEPTIPLIPATYMRIR